MYAYSTFNRCFILMLQLWKYTCWCKLFTMTISFPFFLHILILRKDTITSRGIVSKSKEQICEKCLIPFCEGYNISTNRHWYTGWPQKRNRRYSRFYRTLLWSTVIFFLTLLDRALFPRYNNTKIIKFGGELFILWVISYGQSFSGFARFPEFRGTINDKLMSNSRKWHAVHKKLLIK